MPWQGAGLLCSQGPEWGDGAQQPSTGLDPSCQHGIPTLPSRDPTDRARGCYREEEGWGRELQEETEVVETRDVLAMVEEGGWRRQEDGMGAGGGAPSPQQVQEVLPVFNAETLQQVLIIHGAHCCSHGFRSSRHRSSPRSELPWQRVCRQPGKR